ncbi:hypothetical protein [Hyphococcus lacteus]|uniref:BAX inhibitor (BI)-1/YccA family protein n=1 Tax=Hyphococcus lacteus TaxID=3143536 RepID=A0ABV3Z401_9PROT
MAITSHPADFADHGVSFGPKAKLAAFYVFVGIIAMAVAIPAALAFGNTAVF